MKKRAFSLILVLSVFCTVFSTVSLQSVLAVNAWPNVTIQAESSQTVHDTGSLSGDSWTCTPGLNTAGFMAYGQDVNSVSFGKTRALFTLKVNNNAGSNDLACRIEVKDKANSTILTYKDIRKNQFYNANTYQNFPLDFFQTTSGRVLEFRVYWYGTVGTTFDRVTVESQNYYWQAENASLISHITGSATGDGWKSVPGTDSADTYMIYGPYASYVPAGDQYAIYRMKIDQTAGNANDIVAQIDVNDYTTGTIVASEDVHRGDFQAGNTYQTFYAHYIQQDGHSMEYRVRWKGNATVTVDYVGVESITYFREDWMGSLSDGINLSKINMPGTHDSGATVEPIAGVAKCQDMTIAQQLRTGVRYLDIRCRHISDSFAIHHGSVYQNLNFDDVLTACYDFLNQYPSETIVMHVKEEYDPTNNTRSFEQTFDSYVAQNPSKWHLGETLPNLEDVRGKIVLVRRFGATSWPKGIEAQSWQDNTTFAINGNLAKLYIQDQYKTSTSTKWTKITDHFNLAKSSQYPDWLFINYASGTDGLIPNVANYASQINPKIRSYFFANTTGRYGIVPMDFVSFNLAFPIITSNFHVAT